MNFTVLWWQKNIKSLTVLFIIIMIICYGLHIVSNLNSLVNQVDQLPMRTKPDVMAKKIARLPRGAHLIIMKKHNDWVYVKRNDLFNHKQVGWVASWLVSDKHLQKLTSLSESTIYLDSGHGGTDTGAISNDGQSYEKTYTLKVAKTIKELLVPSGARVIMTRTTDTFVDLKPRANNSQKVKANVFISFHFDSSPTPNQASGVTQYYYHQDNGSKKLASFVSKNLNHVGLPNRGIHKGNILVLRDNSQPAILLENGYMNNDKDIKYIRSKKYRQQVSKDVVKGIRQYVNSIPQ